MSEQIENPFLIAETAERGGRRRDAPAASRAGGSQRQRPVDSPRRLVVDETSGPRLSSAARGPLASIPGLERLHPLAVRLARARRIRGRARWVAGGGMCAAVPVVVLLAVFASAGGGMDPRLIAARRTIASLSSTDHGLQAQVLALTGAQRRLDVELRAARAQVHTDRARLGAVQARHHGHRRGRRR